MIDNHRLSEFTIRVPGKPEGQRRPRAFSRGNHAGVYKSDDDVSYGGRIFEAWIREGRPYLDGPMVVTITASFERPRSHYTTKGELSAAGRRRPRPTMKPDLDNIVKIFLDSLSSAWVDDSYIIGFAGTCKRWCGPNERAGVELHARLVRELDRGDQPGDRLVK